MRKFDVKGTNILIFGDLHFSDVFTGKHKNYLENCIYCLNKLTELVREKKPSAVVLLGDIVGWSETNIKNREVLSLLCRHLREWNTYGKVYAVRGNHDIKGYPEFDFLRDIGLIVTSKDCEGYFDFYGNNDNVPEVRFHIVDYKEEHRMLNKLAKPTTNIVLGHNNYTIAGETTWYSEHDGIEVSHLQNFNDVDMIISGHIHNPSPNFVHTIMPSGNICQLLYTGCPTRPIKDKNMYELCWAVEFAYHSETDSTDVDTISIELKPSTEIFFEDESFVDDKTTEDLEEELNRQAALKDVIGDLLKYRMNQGNPLEQIDNVPNATKEAKELAKQYLQIALNNART